MFADLMRINVLVQEKGAYSAGGTREASRVRKRGCHLRLKPYAAQRASP